MGLRKLATAAALIGFSLTGPAAAQTVASPKTVVATLIKLAEAIHGDALVGARDLNAAAVARPGL